MTCTYNDVCVCIIRKLRRDTWPGDLWNSWIVRLEQKPNKNEFEQITSRGGGGCNQKHGRRKNGPTRPGSDNRMSGDECQDKGVDRQRQQTNSSECGFRRKEKRQSNKVPTHTYTETILVESSPETKQSLPTASLKSVWLSFELRVWTKPFGWIWKEKVCYACYSSVCVRMLFEFRYAMLCDEKTAINLISKKKIVTCIHRQMCSSSACICRAYTFTVSVFSKLDYLKMIGFKPKAEGWFDLAFEVDQKKSGFLSLTFKKGLIFGFDHLWFGFGGAK